MVCYGARVFSSKMPDCPFFTDILHADMGKFQNFVREFVPERRDYIRALTNIGTSFVTLCLLVLIAYRAFVQRYYPFARCIGTRNKEGWFLPEV